jgi:hypothetical protein
MNSPKHTVELDSPDSDSSTSPSDILPTSLLSGLSLQPSKTARFRSSTQEGSDEDDETPTVSSFALALKQARRVTPYPTNKDTYFEDSTQGESEDSGSDYEEEGDGSMSIEETSFRQVAETEVA